MDDLNRNEIREYLTFGLDADLYAINVANIKEVLGVPRVTRVPRMPAFMSGVINLRGNVVPVLDLRRKFGLGETQYSADTSIIVTELRNVFKEDEDESFTIGIFSDIVHKVVSIEQSMIEPPPKIGVAINSEFITGMGRIDDDFVIILNVNRLLSEKEFLLSPAEGVLTHE
jgi:purine-binding chemotaxis protein CheW